MATEGQGHSDRSCMAATDLSASQYLFVKISASGRPPTVALTAAATDCPYGVLQDKPVGSAGTPKACEVRVQGRSKVVAGGTITAGDRIGTDNAGKAVKKTEGTDTTNYVVGVAVFSAVTGDIVEVDLNCLNPHRAA